MKLKNEAKHMAIKGVSKSVTKFLETSLNIHCFITTAPQLPFLAIMFISSQTKRWILIQYPCNYFHSSKKMWKYTFHASCEIPQNQCTTKKWHKPTA
jgi:hypothetical protein